MTDHEIIQQVLSGNPDRFSLLVERYQPVVFRTCMGFVHDQDDADDLSQEIFIQAYLSLSSFKGESAFPTWIYRIAVNAALNKSRKTAKNFLTLRLNKMLGVGKRELIDAASGESPEDLFIREEHRQWVQDALDSLPKNQHTAIVLSKYDDLPQKEIAAIMGISEGAVEALIQRAKAGLRKELSAAAKKNKKNRRKN